MIYFTAPKGSPSFKAVAEIFIKISCSEEKHDEQTNGWMDRQMNDPNTICPSNFFEVWDIKVFILTLLLLSTTCPVLANSEDPDQLASEEAN